MRSAAFAAAFAAAHAASAQLPAAESGLELTWQAPPECPQPDLVRAAIGELVGGAPDEPIATRIEVRGTVAKSPQGYQVWLSWRTREADEQRLLEAASCAELARASALVVAFAIGTERETTERDAGATENPGPGQQQATAPATAAPRGVSSEEIVFPDLDLPQALSSRAPSEPGIRVDTRLQLAADFGSLAAPSAGLLAGLQVQGGPWMHGVEAGISLPQRITDSGRSGRFFWGVLAFRTCHAYPGQLLSASPCLIAELHVLRGKGENLARDEERYAWIPRAGVGLELRHRISPLVALFTSGYQLLAPWRPTFVVGEAVVFEPALLSARLSAGVELRLP